MPRLPRPSGKEVLAFLMRRGFVVVRINGSHHVLSKGVLRTSIPVHGNETLKIGTLQGLLRDIGMSAEEFIVAWSDK